MMLDPEILIVGAGPAGLAAALELVSRGISNILIIDRDDAPGGLPRFCAHPGFGLGYLAVPRSGPAFARTMLHRLEKTGVRVLCGTTLVALNEGPTATIVGPETGHTTLRPRAVIVATGIREANRGNRQVPGDRPSSGIMTTGQLQQMVARGVAFPATMNSLVIVGTEHVSFSAIWTARHAGLRVRTMIEQRPGVSSFAAAGWLARLSGVDIQCRARVVKICASGDRVSSVITEQDGLSRETACDGVVFTAGWIPEVAALQTGPILIDSATGGIAANGVGQASLPGVFAAGNVRYPLKASGMCARQGQQTAAALVNYLR